MKREKEREEKENKESRGSKELCKPRIDEATLRKK